MSTLAIIPARGGSVRVPNKNIRLFHGRPIIDYSIVCALDSGLFDEVIVSTDDEAIAEISRKGGARVFRRELDDGIRGTQDVAREVLMHRRDADVACVIYATCPMLVPSDLARGHALLTGYKDMLYAMGVQTNPLADAGMMYWGRADAFRVEAPLVDAHTIMVPMPAARVCDINTFDDWSMAEQMYARWKVIK